MTSNKAKHGGEWLRRRFPFSPKGEAQDMDLCTGRL